MVRNIYLGLFILLLISACLDPYEVNTKGYKDLLVVDALITSENKTHRVHLSHSTSNIDEQPVPVSGASVTISDDLGNICQLTGMGGGLYVTDSTSFVTQIGRSYQLDIVTSEGKKYQSTSCKILPETQIGSIYYRKDTQWDISNRESLGISILSDGVGINDAAVRWTYEEFWKFAIPYPSAYSYNENYQLEAFAPENVYCWKSHISNNISIQSFSEQENPEIREREIVFIPTGVTDKLTIRYSILIKQMTISNEEYNYWKKLQASTEDIGDIFGKQPFSIVGNIKNISDSKEPVLGYFKVASVTSKRFYINLKDLSDFDLPKYNSASQCELTVYNIGEIYHSGYEIYEKQVLAGPYRIYYPIYQGLALIGLALSPKECSDCRFKGTDKKPYFWED